MSFETIQHKNISFLVYKPWWQSGLRHGFCNRSIDFKSEKREQSKLDFSNAFSIKKLILPLQVHGTDIIDVEADYSNVGQISDGSCQADAISGIACESTESASIGLGVLTADCVPLLIKLGKHVALVHAGWKGLANGIISQVISEMGSKTDEKHLEVLIGPCAGPREYEVGTEVISEIGAQAVSYKQGGRPLQNPSNVFLSLAETAAAIVTANYSRELSIYSVKQCTISNPEYFSYRREGGSAGRNLTFVII